MLGERDGGFSTSSYPSGSVDYGGSAVVLRDLNGDGLPDIVAADNMGLSGAQGFGLPALYVFLNKGEGLFGDPTPYPFGATAGLSQQLAVSDFNGDCWPDLLATRDVGCDPSLPGLYLFLNRGDGTFADPPMSLLSVGGQGVAAYRPAGASLPSIAVADACIGRFQVLSNLTKP
jgi:hypothetical protein